MDASSIVLDNLNPKLNITLVRDDTGLSAVADFLNRSDLFGFDTETNVVPRFFNRKIRTIQVGDKNEQYVIDLLGLAGSSDALQEQGGKQTPRWAKRLYDALAVGLESNTKVKVGMNLQFDYEVMRWCLGMRLRKFYDCLLAEKVIYCGAVHFMDKNFWGLEDLIARYCKLIISKEQQKTFDLEMELTAEQIQYGGLDTRLPLAIRNAQLRTLEKDGLLQTVDIENGAIMAFGDMHLNGLKVGHDKWMAQVEDKKVQYVKDIVNMDKVFIPIVGDKAVAPQLDLAGLESNWKNEKNKLTRQLYQKEFYSARKIMSAYKKALLKYEGQAAINYGAPLQVLAALQKSGLKIQSTDDKVLAKIDSNPLIKALRDYRGTEKSLDTYGVSFLEDYVDPDTGRVHSNISQLGAESGRTASAKPNVQNIPKGPEYRSCFVARPGYKYIRRDYDGCELRIIAEESGEELWINAFNEGRDVHSICAEMMFSVKWKAAAEPGCAFYKNYERMKCKCSQHKLLRDWAKAVNFGIPYGMEEVALADKLSITRQEAKKLLKLHASTFLKVHAYLKRSAESAKIKFEARTACGRRRLFTKPTWELARAKAIKQAEEWGRAMNSDSINKAYWSMFGNIEREGKNTPIQGGNADIIKVAMGLMWEHLEPVYGGLLVNMIHDELGAEAPEDKAESCSEFMAEKMELAGTYFVKSMRMTTDGAISDCWEK